jgi:hypothetical protein
VPDIASWIVKFIVIAIILAAAFGLIALLYPPPQRRLLHQSRGLEGAWHRQGTPPSAQIPIKLIGILLLRLISSNIKSVSIVFIESLTRASPLIPTYSFSSPRKG